MDAFQRLIQSYESGYTVARSEMEDVIAALGGCIRTDTLGQEDLFYALALIGRSLSSGRNRA